MNNKPGHFKKVGSCGHVITQCRCPGPKEEIKLDEVCPSCYNKKLRESGLKGASLR